MYTFVYNVQFRYSIILLAILYLDIKVYEKVHYDQYHLLIC